MIRNCFVNLFFLIVLVLPFQFLIGQVQFNSLRDQTNFSQSIVYEVEQDASGMIWMITDEGVVRYNSEETFLYNKYNGLPANIGFYLQAIFKDSKDRIWIGGDEGFAIYNPNLDRFDLVDLTKETSPKGIKDLLEDETGAIWIAGFNGLFKIDAQQENISQITKQLAQNSLIEKNKEIYYSTYNQLFVTSLAGTNSKVVKEFDAQVEELFLNHKNNIVVGLNNGKIIELNNQFETVQEAQFKNPIRDIELRNNNYYIATDGSGVIKTDLTFTKIDQYVKNVDEPNSLTINGIYDIFFDKDDVLWVATYGGGLNYYDPFYDKMINLKHKINNVNSLQENYTRVIAQSSNGDIWFGTKEGVSIFNKTENSWRQVKEFSAIPLCIVEDNNDFLIGTYDDGLLRVNKNTLQITQMNQINGQQLKVKRIYAIDKDDFGTIWLGGIDGPLTSISTKNEVKTYPIFSLKSIKKLSNGSILAAGRTGVYEINTITHQFTEIKELGPDVLNYLTINSIEQTTTGDLLLATTGIGFIIYKPESKQTLQFNQTNGLASDNTQGVVQQNTNQIWVSTSKGLNKIDFYPTDTVISTFTKQDGFINDEYNYGSYAKLTNDFLAFGGIDGVTLFKASSIETIEQPSNIVFERLQVLGKTILPGNSILSKSINLTDYIELKPNQDSFSLSFASIKTSLPKHIIFSYRLLNIEEKWSKSSRLGTASYSNLKPGKYEFQVRSSNNGLDWSEPQSIEIKINNYWWATNSAIILYLLLLAGAIWALIHITHVLGKKKNAEDQIDFFNNTIHEIKTPLAILLTSLQSAENESSSTKSEKKIKGTVKRLSALFEQMLQFQSVITTHSSIQKISQIDLGKYLADIESDFSPLFLEKEIDFSVFNRYNSKFIFYDEENLNKIFYNLISNAIKYTNHGGEIIIDVTNGELNRIEIVVEDNGIGIPENQQKLILSRFFRARNVQNSQAPGSGLGLMITKNIIEKAGGSISFTSTENVGTRFNISIINLEKEFYTELTKQEDELYADEMNQQIPFKIEEFSDKKVLLVEDNDELRSLLSSKLGEYFQVFEAKNGKEGLAKTSEIFPNIILTDLIMPEMDGIQLCQALKEDINYNHIPVFMLTVLRNSELEKQSIESGVNEFINKPVDVNLLLNKMTNLFIWQQKLRDKYIHESDLTSALEHRNDVDEKFLTDLEQFVKDNLVEENLSVNDLCLNVGMSRTSLYMKLKNLVDLSPQDFIIHTKLKVAKDLLVSSDKNIKEVAFHSGFSNAKYFSTSFKKFYGESPSAFKRSIQKDLE